MGTIPKFGADSSGGSGNSSDITPSLGKLYSGGTNLFLFVQNKVKKESQSVTSYSNCSQWIVFEYQSYPLEGASCNFQDEPNIIWGPNSSISNSPPSVTGNPNSVTPATVAQCYSIIGCEGSHQVSCKTDGKLNTTAATGTVNGADAIDKIITGGVSATGLENWMKSVPWSMSYSLQKPRTDWWVETISGHGYTVNSGSGGKITGLGGMYNAKSWSATGRGDITYTTTEFQVLTS